MAHLLQRSQFVRAAQLPQVVARPVCVGLNIRVGVGRLLGLDHSHGCALTTQGGKADEEKSSAIRVLSVAVALTASGCFGGLIADIVGGLTEEIAIEAAVKAFLEAWDQGSAESMKSQLAPIVTFHPELFGESANPESSDDVVAGLLAPEEDRQVVEVELGGSVEALRTGDEATASAKVRVKCELDIDAELKALPGDEDSLYVEDIYPMAFGLIKDGSGWKINYLNIKTGT